MKPGIIFILGAGHCGSTVLNLALDKHSDVCGVSEIVGLNKQERGWAGSEDFRKHEFWKRVATVYETNFDGDFWSVLFAPPGRRGVADKDKWAQENRNALLSIAKTSGASVIADASKHPGRLEALLQSDLLDIRVVYLVRDARAITHSYDRKYGSVWHGLRKLWHLDRRARSIKRRDENVAWMTLRYEDMTEDFDSTIRHVCDFCGISFQDDMLRPDTRSFKGVGGNRLRHQPVNAITPDKSWEREMPAWKQALVSFFFIGYHFRLGYPIAQWTSRKDTSS